MSEKMKNLLVRTASGVVLTVVVLAAVLASPWSFGALLLAILVGSLWEFYRMHRREEVRPLTLLGILSGMMIFAAAFALFAAFSGFLEPNFEQWALPTLFWVVVLLVPLMLVRELFSGRPNPAANIGITLAGLCYVVLPLSALLFIPWIVTGGAWWQPASHVMLAYIFIIWANDVFAYLVGSAIGRHRLCERISPKKSWEGFFGGLAGAATVGLLAGHFVGNGHGYGFWAGFALVAAVSGVLGDLVESMFKRAAGVKDSGNILPGHGGWLDRFDALIFSVPFVLTYVLFVFFLR